ncbi:ribosome-associated translation inhibitor RaiA [Opitutus sp. ER46]|uniref:ribosome hibernation-promoting factor, HPF/YfiA family n=1 Tax=Opitutus sp. ER46 TaxID=2161864 RepID=UPI000D300AFF|nr:ribosome-associated translation inhibitor RaiA [Opitutus sp. ER46]PTX96420.1 ribosome-associated translation inhibitor RaiA [Opitutus sp. ER46]
MNTNPDDLASKLILQGVHVELTPAMQDVIRDKFGVLLRHNEWIIRLNIRLNKDQARGRQNHFTATGHIEIGGPDLVAHVESDDAYSALDGLVDKLDKLLRDRHERRKDKRNHPEDIEIDAPLPKIPGR